MIEKNKVVQFHYTLSESGVELENSKSGDPIAYLHGHNNIIVGLQEAMAGKNAGDTFEVEIAPEKAYGKRNEDAKQRVPLKHLIGAKKWRPGMVAQVETDQGQRQVTVIKVGKFNADVDANHPLAGKSLSFHIEVVDVRDASEEEISHGHAHGLGGHHH
jgi:FKBP-type peptidyl-prolyl cis-trans isomerase SlyD